MKIAYFDCFAGISGDMAVGALLDAGVPLVVVENAMEQLGLSGRLSLATRTVVRSMIQATKFDVLDTEGAPIDRTPHEHLHPVEHHHPHEHPHTHGDHGDSHRHEHSHSHPHEHTHEHTHAHHDHGHAHEHMHPHHHSHDGEHGHTHHHHGHEHSHAHSHEHASYGSIVRMIEESGLCGGVKSRAISILREIGIAEGRIHGMPLEEVHFHEVGALDSIADIVAVAACLEHLGVEAVFTSAIPLGSGGTIRTQHGVMPLPAPATLEILKGYTIQLTSLPFELTTPTGAGIVKALSRGSLVLERMRVERVGFGAGTRELPDRPNLLRVAIGEILQQEEYDDVMLVESTIDDMNPQIYPWLIERLLESGALDAWITSVTMKKGRPGIVLSVVAPAGAVDAVTEVIYRETTTIGVRFAPYARRKLPREEVLVPTPWGAVRMKRISGVEGVRLAPEYEEARRIARENGLPLRQVMTTLGDIARSAAGQVGGEE